MIKPRNERRRLNYLVFSSKLVIYILYSKYFVYYLLLTNLLVRPIKAITIVRTRAELDDLISVWCIMQIVINLSDDLVNSFPKSQPIKMGAEIDYKTLAAQGGRLWD